MKTYKYYPIIAGLFTAVLVLSNILDTKIFSIWSLSLPAGIVLFPIAYVFGDILTEVYGYAASRKIIWTGFFALVLMVVSAEIARALPPASFWQNQKEYDIILGKVPRLVAASISAYFIGEFANSFTLAKLKVMMKGNQVAVRLVGSTIIGQLVDTTVFVLVAFAGTIDFLRKSFIFYLHLQRLLLR